MIDQALLPNEKRLDTSPSHQPIVGRADREIHHLSTFRELELLRDLQRLANERQETHERIEREHQAALEAGQNAYAAARTAAEREHNRAKQQLERDHAAAMAQAEATYEHARSTAQNEYHGLRTSVEGEHDQAKREAQERLKETAWQILTVFDAQKGRPRERLDEAIARLKTKRDEVAVLQQDAIAILQMRRQWTTPIAEKLAPAAILNGQPSNGNASLAESEADDDAVAQAEQHVQLAVDRVRADAQALYDRRITRLLEGGTPPLIVFTIFTLAAVAAGFSLGWTNWIAWASVVAITCILSVGVFAWLIPQSRRAAAHGASELQSALTAAHTTLDTAARIARARSERDATLLVSKRDADLAAIGFEVEQLLGEKRAWRKEELSRVGEVYPARLVELKRTREAQRSQMESEFHHQIVAITAKRDSGLRAAESELRRSEQQAVQDRDAAWQKMAHRWFSGYDAIVAAFGEIRDTCQRLFPDWGRTAYANWPKPTEICPAIEFGRATLHLSVVKSGIAADPRLRPAQTGVEVPALMTLAEHPGMVLTAEGEGRQRAIDVMQAVMLRFFTAMPPGKVRFTILDPIGLGENFASFMHLADYEEQLIAGRIWTEARDIDEQLLRLTTHMETVLQKYLRNEYATIHEYNAQAGEVAEPFVVLVIAGFPTNFSEAAARRLVSIATGGPRCGVYTIVMLDRKQRLPNDFRLEELTAQAVHLDWQVTERKFRWRFPAFERLPLTVAALPPADQMIEVLRAAGAAAKDAVRVEVPFSVVVPRDGLWRENCSQELRVPVGRAGANRLQYVRLGKGTSQHLLVAGKTGSGKSTFLHAFITSAALHLSPEEMEFYLIDFKKGVEFKAYATGRLPHARVVAIESEREFGLSVLERLDQELKQRGEAFRMAGVQGLADFRAARPDCTMPRILLVIDEFQEFFIEDDRLAQDATLLLDRLVRQGRAFGIHVLLGSQTLSGAFSLARSTLGQMAVRVALQCSEADAHLILSDERNEAARFLSRPGEAIYNDQNGLVSANEPFQVVWLPDQERIEHLATVRREADRRALRLPPAIVFEGDAPADPAENAPLAALLQGDTAPTGTSRSAWLGAAVAIKEPTHAVFGRHAGSNLLLVGAQEPAALGVLTSAVISLAAADRPQSIDDAAGARFCIFDGARAGDAGLGAWQRVADALPHETSVFAARETATGVAQAAAELARREQEQLDHAPPWYLVIYNGGRLRELRRSDDDFSFSVDRDKSPNPDKQLAEILRNGPSWGIHTLVWCDSYNSLTRMFDRSTLREFEMRVALQMSAADSSNLLDSPAASHLKLHGAILVAEDTGTFEKFRPYSPPTDAWLRHVAELLSPPVPARA